MKKALIVFAALFVAMMLLVGSTPIRPKRKPPPQPVAATSFTRIMSCSQVIHWPKLHAISAQLGGNLLSQQ